MKANWKRTLLSLVLCAGFVWPAGAVKHRTTGSVADWDEHRAEQTGGLYRQENGSAGRQAYGGERQ